MTDLDFVAWLEEQLLASTTEKNLHVSSSSSSSSSNTAGGSCSPSSQQTSSSLTSLSTAEGKEFRGDSILDILWCYAEQLSQPGKLFPCCAVLMRDKVVLERLILTGAESSLPRLEPCTIMPISNIQQLVVGPCHAFLRLEEAFVGKPGTYTIFGLEPQGLKRFAGQVLQVCGDLDVSNPPESVDLSIESDLLKRIITWEEQTLGVGSDRLAVAILVKEVANSNFSFLVLSENQVYCLDTAFVHWPPVTFQTLPDEASIAFEVLHAFSITDKISNIKIHPMLPPDSTAAASSQPAVFSIRDEENPFLQFQLDLQVVLSFSAATMQKVSPTQPRPVGGIALKDSNPGQHSSEVSYLFFSAAHRDLFLDRLTNLRAEQAHRMSPNVREEPEGGNEVPAQINRCSDFSAEPVSQGSADVGSELNQKAGPDTKSVTIMKSEESAVTIPERGEPGDKEKEKKTDRTVKHGKAAQKLKPRDEDTVSTGSTQTATSGDTTIYFSASPSDDLSVSPMSNFSRASISPPTSSGMQQAGGKKNFTSHVVSVEVSASLPNAKVKDKDVVLLGGCSDEPVLPQLSSTAQPPISNSSPAASGLKTTEDPRQQGAGALKAVSSAAGNLDHSPAYEHLPRLPDAPMSAPEVESDLDKHLRQCVRSYNLLTPLPAKVKPLYLMSGPDLRRFFKTNVADPVDPLVDGRGDRRLGQRDMEVREEELRHLLWTFVVPYTNPKHEVVTLVMISTHGVYLVSDTPPPRSHKSRPSWMTHTRNQSDSVVAWKSANIATAPFPSSSFSKLSHPAGDGLNKGKSDSVTAAGSTGHSSRIVKPYFKFCYSDLQQVHVGVFDQCVRLTGSDADSVFTLAVRDSAAVESLVQYLKDMLTLALASSTHSPDPDSSDMDMLSSWDGELDVYREDLQRTKSTLEGIVYTHPSQVRFVYPGEDSIRDILYLVNQRAGQPGNLHGKTSSTTSVSTSSSSPGQLSSTLHSSLWLYLLCHQLPGTKGQEVNSASQPRTVIVTPTHFSLSQEDIVTYPLPDFVRGLPETPCHQIVECRPIEALKRVRLYHSDPHRLALTFVDEADDFVVDASMDHFSTARAGREKQGLSPEVTLHLFITSPQEKDKMVALLEKLWRQLVTQVGRILDVARV